MMCPPAVALLSPQACHIMATSSYGGLPSFLLIADHLVNILVWDTGENRLLASTEAPA